MTTERKDAIEAILYGKEPPLTRQLYITIYTEVDCPKCAVARNILDWLENEYYPYLIINDRYVGDTIPRSKGYIIEEGTEFSFSKIGLEIDALNFIQFFDGKVPLTEFPEFNEVISGIDMFSLQIQAAGITKEDMIQALDRDEISQVIDGKLDGIDYAWKIHSRYIHPKDPERQLKCPTLINERFLKAYSNKINSRDKIYSKLIDKKTGGKK